MEPIYEGKAKRLYTTDNPNVLRMEYKDDATAGNGAKKAQFENKGRMNKAITLVIYRMLESKGVKTHLVADVDDINIDVKKVSILPLEVIVRNIAAGSFSRRMGVKEGTPFKKPIVEFSYKDDSLGDPFINDDYAREMNAATEEECVFLKNQARIVNDVLIDFFKQVGLTLVDFKIEFGRLAEDPSQIVLADEISPDTCRLWDAKTRSLHLSPPPMGAGLPPAPIFHFTTLLSDMTLHFEVISRFQAAANADALLYTPLNAGLTFRRSRVYTVEITGDGQKAREYLLSVLVDPISQECTEQNAPILEGALFTIDYGMKAGALDLEKEAILQNYRGRRNMGFTMDGLKITQRVYVFGQGDKETLAARFAKDVCNPAIHNWTIA